MLKKIIVSITLVVASTSQAHHYGAAGCGLGSNLMGADGSQVLAATTNGTSYTNMFGITSGTSNCTPESGHASARLPLFIEANSEAMAKDLSRGQGETVDHLAGVLGCDSSQELGSHLKAHFEEIFPATEKLDSEKVSDSILNVIKRDGKLAASCKHIG